MPDAQLADLAEEHEQFKELLLRALDAISEGRAQDAREIFHSFEEALLSHAAAEEQHLIPLFAARGLESVGCSAAILLSDHAKLRRLLREASAQLPPSGAVVPARLRVTTVLGMRNLIELLAHHDERERAAFFPALDRALAPQERAALYAICARNQASA